MYEAAEAGELGVCRFLWEHGGASTIRTINNEGNTPMFAACTCGHLNLAKWLFDAGAAQDIHKGSRRCSPMLTVCSRGHLEVAKWLFAMGADIQPSTKPSPMFSACAMNHLDVVKWLFEVGADIRSEGSILDTPLNIACRCGNLGVGLWLLLQGAANGADGHVDQDFLGNSVPSHCHRSLTILLQRQVDKHATFTSTVLTATINPATPITKKPSTTSPRSRQTSCALSLLHGHEGGVLPLIADFVGVLRGRQLRNAREVLTVLVLFAEEEDEADQSDVGDEDDWFSDGDVEGGEVFDDDYDIEEEEEEEEEVEEKESREQVIKSCTARETWL